MITSPDFEGVVSPSRPVVEPGDEVAADEMIAVPSGDGISNAQHASIDGEVTEVSDRYAELARPSDGGGRTPPEAGRTIYRTWCVECGEYVARPERERFTSGTTYVCESCRWVRDATASRPSSLR